MQRVGAGAGREAVVADGRVLKTARNHAPSAFRSVALATPDCGVATRERQRKTSRRVVVATTNGAAVRGPNLVGRAAANGKPGEVSPIDGVRAATADGGMRFVHEIVRTTADGGAAVVIVNDVALATANCMNGINKSGGIAADAVINAAAERCAAFHYRVGGAAGNGRVANRKWEGKVSGQNAVLISAANASEFSK